MVMQIVLDFLLNMSVQWELGGIVLQVVVVKLEDVEVGLVFFGGQFFFEGVILQVVIFYVVELGGGVVVESQLGFFDLLQIILVFGLFGGIGYSVIIVFFMEEGILVFGIFYSEEFVGEVVQVVVVSDILKEVGIYYIMVIDGIQLYYIEFIVDGFIFFLSLDVLVFGVKWFLLQCGGLFRDGFEFLFLVKIYCVGDFQSFVFLFFVISKVLGLVVFLLLLFVVIVVLKKFFCKICVEVFFG